MRILGNAQRLFIERCQKNPWEGFDCHSDDVKWPFLEGLIESQRLDYLDFAIAQKMLSHIPHADEACAAFICHLSIAARYGHLCVNINNEEISPSPKEIWMLKEGWQLPENESHKEMQRLELLIKQGAKMMPKGLIYEGQNKEDSVDKPFCKFQNNYYLQRYWYLEGIFVDHVRTLFMHAMPPLAVDEMIVKWRVAQWLESKQLLQEQAEAVINGCLSSFTIICGGPGTGKTHTAGKLLRAFWEGLTIEQRKHCRIELAAPTGKAAANLEGSIRRALEGIQDFPALNAKTLHALLGINQYTNPLKSIRTLQTDLLLVDECSMIDAEVMGRLMASIKPGTRLILLGDRDQLPPVEAGSFFTDLVAYLMASKYSTSVVELETCLRTESSEIIEFAKRIKLGNGEETCQWISTKPDLKRAVRFIPFAENIPPIEMQRQLLDYALPYFDYDECDFQILLKKLSRFRILTPLKKGLFGVEILNRLIFQKLQAKSHHERLAVPIMVVQNDYKQGLFNGEVGVLLLHGESHYQNYALFASKDKEDGVRKIPFILLPKYEYAYCLSVHKSQGSEFDHVVLVLPDGTELFGREVLYTGVTRARSSLELWGSTSLLKQIVDQQTKRHSGVVSRLNNASFG